jgi:hypothetical protein
MGLKGLVLEYEEEGKEGREKPDAPEWIKYVEVGGGVDGVADRDRLAASEVTSLSVLCVSL